MMLPPILSSTVPVLEPRCPPGAPVIVPALDSTHYAVADFATLLGVGAPVAEPEIPVEQDAQPVEPPADLGALLTLLAAFTPPQPPAPSLPQSPPPAVPPELVIDMSGEAPKPEVASPGRQLPVDAPAVTQQPTGPAVLPVPAALPPPFLAEPPPTLPVRLAAQLVVALPRLTGDGRTTELALSPAQLGKVTVSWDGQAVGQPVLRIVAAEPATAHLLSALRDQIAAAMMPDGGTASPSSVDLRIDIAADARGLVDRRLPLDGAAAALGGGLIDDQSRGGRGTYRPTPSEASAAAAVNSAVVDEGDGNAIVTDQRLA
jgi:hypothetical protein